MSRRSDDERLLSDPNSKKGKLQRACLDVLRQHEREYLRTGDGLPTNGHFVFYELEQTGIVPKQYDGLNPKTGKPWRRTPLQDVSDALMHLREVGLVPWWWIEDETRSLDNWQYDKTVADYVKDAVTRARIDLWQGEEPPLILCEARTMRGVLRSAAYDYLTPITATNGQSGGFTVTDIVPLLMGKRRVLYVGDHELRGPAEQIEANTKRYIEKHTGRTFADGEWVKIALTEQQVKASRRLQRLIITKLDKRYKPPKPYQAVECEALGQGVLVRLVRKVLDTILPEPLADVQKREQEQRKRVTAALTRLKLR
jgi:hypothetical protein